jgi:endo-1,4-beta-D-glucanase Y
MKSRISFILSMIIFSVLVATSCTLKEQDISEGLPPLHEKEMGETDRLPYREKLLLGFVMREMLSPYGGIYTNYNKNGVFEYGVKGREVLSESVGLMMYYAVLRGNKEIFDIQYKFLTEGMMTKEGFIPWKVEEDGTPSSYSSATIDDIRIAYSLIKAHQLWGDREYLNTARTIADNIMKYEVHNNNLVDFYDWEYGRKSNTIKLSYIDIKGLEVLARYQPGLLTVADRGLELLEKARYSSQYPFRKIKYNYEKKAFQNETTINLIDTLYVSIHLSEAGIEQKEMLDWMKREISQRHKIFGRYHPIKGQPVVDFESAAVYALGMQLCLREGDKELANELMERLLMFQDMREDAPTYGGFIDLFNGNGHSFDNLQALVAMALLYR